MKSGRDRNNLVNLTPSFPSRNVNRMEESKQETNKRIAQENKRSSKKKEKSLVWSRFVKYKTKFGKGGVTRVDDGCGAYQTSALREHKKGEEGKNKEILLPI